MPYFEKQLDEEIMFKGRLLTVAVDHVELIDGSVGRREIIKHPGGVCIVPIDPDGNVIAVRQYRFAVSEELLEIPAGKLEAGEDPKNCAIRELSEETGCSAREVISLGQLFATPGYCGEMLHIFLALGLTQGEQHLDKGEFLDVERIPFRTLVQQAADGTIKDAKTVIGLLRAERYLSTRSDIKF